jgi:hypothetical protein
MRNISPTVLSSMPPAVQQLADLELAFNARRRELIIAAGACLTAARVLTQPSMAWVDGPRTQPRDGRGRFLSRVWLAEAELFLPADLAWFRQPITASQEGR